MVCLLKRKTVIKEVKRVNRREWSNKINEEIKKDTFKLRRIECII